MASCVTTCDGRMNESTLLRCLETIKQLKSKNEKLNHENQKLQEQLVTVTQKINDVRNGEATLSFHQNQPITTPTAENETLMELTKVNQALQEKLQANNVDMSDFMRQSQDKEEHNMLMEGYRKKIQILKQENKTLRENSSCEQMATKMSRLSTLLEKCCAVNQSYAEKIEKLQKDLSSLAAEVPPCVKMDDATTKAHAASNDYDFPHGNRTASGENVRHPEEEVKSPGQRSSSESSSEMNLRRMTSREDDSMVPRSHLDKALLDLHNLQEEKKKLTEFYVNENGALKAEIKEMLREKENWVQNMSSQSQESLGIYEYQMKAFQEDFEQERNEKEQLLRQKNDLEMKMDALKKTLQSQPSPYGRDLSWQITYPGTHNPHPGTHNPDARTNNPHARTHNPHPMIPHPKSAPSLNPPQVQAGNQSPNVRDHVPPPWNPQYNPSTPSYTTGSTHSGPKRKIGFPQQNDSNQAPNPVTPPTLPHQSHQHYQRNMQPPLPQQQNYDSQLRFDSFPSDNNDKPSAP